MSTVKELGKNNMTLLELLWHLKQHGPCRAFRSFGICYIASNSLEARSDYYRMKALFQQWPENTGSVMYPVPGTGGRDEEQAYDNEPLWSGEYGGNRLRLINFCINELTKEANNG